jgi:hypothetical protein
MSVNLVRKLPYVVPREAAVRVEERKTTRPPVGTFKHDDLCASAYTYRLSAGEQPSA